MKRTLIIVFIFILKISIIKAQPCFVDKSDTLYFTIAKFDNLMDSLNFKKQVIRSKSNNYQYIIMPKKYLKINIAKNALAYHDFYIFKKDSRAKGTGTSRIIVYPNKEIAINQFNKIKIIMISKKLYDEKHACFKEKKYFVFENLLVITYFYTPVFEKVIKNKCKNYIKYNERNLYFKN